MVALITSAGPLKVDDLSCRRILTSSKGVTTNDSVAPARKPVVMAIDCVVFFCPFSVSTDPQNPFPATRRSVDLFPDESRGKGEAYI